MNFGIILPVGDSFKNMAKSGQDIRFKKFYLSAFAREFEKVIIFSYENEKVSNLPQNVLLIPNKYGLHKYIYAVLIPFLNIGEILKCDVLRVYHLFGTPPAIISRLIFGKPYIFNYAYDYKKFAQIENKSFKKFLISVIAPIAILFAKKIFAANKVILKKLPKQKAVYLPNGVVTSVFKPASRKKKNTASIILSVGRLEKQKNFEVLIKAMEGINAKLLLVGQGSQKEKLKKLALDINVDLKIIDKVENTEMPQIYNSADIFVLPSLAEGSSKVLLEAMACGLAVIAANVEGVSEIIKDWENGLVVESNSDNLSSTISFFLKNSEITSKISKSARETIIKNFNLEKLLGEEVNHYKN